MSSLFKVYGNGVLLLTHYINILTIKHSYFAKTFVFHIDSE